MIQRAHPLCTNPFGANENRTSGMHHSIIIFATFKQIIPQKSASSYRWNLHTHLWKHCIAAHLGIFELLVKTLEMNSLNEIVFLNSENIHFNFILLPSKLHILFLQIKWNNVNMMKQLKNLISENQNKKLLDNIFLSPMVIWPFNKH